MHNKNPLLNKTPPLIKRNFEIFETLFIKKPPLNKGAKRPKNFGCGFDLYTNLDVHIFYSSETLSFVGFPLNSAEGGKFFGPCVIKPPP